MNTKYILFVLFVTLCVAQALAACGTAAPAAPVSEPSTAPLPAPTATPEIVDPAAVAQEFYKAANEHDFDAAMAFVADDIECRGGCYITGKESFRSYIVGGFSNDVRIEISDLKVGGDTVTYNWKVFNKDGIPVAQGVEVMHIKDGKIILLEISS